MEVESRSRVYYRDWFSHCLRLELAGQKAALFCTHFAPVYHYHTGRGVALSWPPIAAIRSRVHRRAIQCSLIIAHSEIFYFN